MYIDHRFHNDGSKSAAAKGIPLHAAIVSSAKVTLPRHADDEGGYTIDVVTSDLHLSDVRLLINRMYSRRGYGSHHDLCAGVGQTTFVVSAAGSIVGTLTLTVDSEIGLATDATFGAELNSYRRKANARVCELTRFAFDVDQPSKRLLAALFHVIFVYGQCRYGCTDLFIEVARRHRRFYETMLGFARVCDLKINDSVGVPSQLMRLRVADIRRNIDEHRRASSGTSGRSLYPFFFSEEEETRICLTLAPMINSGCLSSVASRGDYESSTAEVLPNASRGSLGFWLAPDIWPLTSSREI